MKQNKTEKTLLNDAINKFKNQVHPWDLTEEEQKNLSNAEKGNVSDFHKLLKSTNLLHNEYFENFFTELEKIS